MNTKPIDLIGFSDFKIPILKIPKLKSLRNPFNEFIYYREIESASDTLVVAVHGMGGDSRYLTQLALALSLRPDAPHVLLPDLKFHGEKNSGSSVKLEPHQDIISELQFLLENIKSKKTFSKIILVGHSLGGAVVLKWLSEQPNSTFHKIVLVSPYLPEPYNVESSRFSKWLKREGIKMLLQFPEKSKWGTEVDEYEESYLRSCLPKDFPIENWLEKCSDISLVVGTDDKILDIQKYRLFFKDEVGIKFFEFSDLSHIGLVTSALSAGRISEAIFNDQ